jgi:Mlc titration factor MtfA (ptsG expression regulator)
MRAEFEQLRSRVQRGESTTLRDYGATNPAEFFAVATEYFFGQPEEVQQQHPELYEEMKWYYQQDPAHWLPARHTRSSHFGGNDRFDGHS